MIQEAEGLPGRCLHRLPLIDMIVLLIRRGVERRLVFAQFDVHASVRRVERVTF